MNKFFLWSTSAHILFFLLLSFTLFLLKDNIAEINKKNLKLIESSVRVDVVSMPEFTMKELKEISMEKPVQAESVESSPEPDKPAAPDKPVDPNDIVLEKETKPKKIFDILKKLSDKSIDTKEFKKDDRLESKKSEYNKKIKDSFKKLVMVGNKLSEGHAVVINGGSKGSSEAIDSYLSKIPEWVKPYWRLPSFLLEKELKCRIRIFIDSSGRILNAQIYESSGDVDYDGRALEAVNKSGPFPPPEESIRSMLLNGEVLLGFPL